MHKNLSFYVKFDIFFTSLQNSKRLDLEEKSSQPNSSDNQKEESGAIKLSSFIADQLTSLPTKLEVPIGTIFFQEGQCCHLLVAFIWVLFGVERLK